MSEDYKLKKAWNTFLKWLKEEYSITSGNKKFFTCCDQDYIHDNLILSIMLFFFDEYEIIIEISLSWIGWECYIKKVKTDIFFSDRFNFRLESSKAACERAFEILEKEIK